MLVSINKSKQIILQALLIISASILLVNCGGGGGSTTSATTTPTPTAATLTGTAATGAPIDGIINVTDSLGATATATIDASGNYTVDVTGMTPPFIIAAVPNDNTLDTQYSFAAQANITVNVTPLTTLTLFNANGQQDLAQLLSNWTSQFNNITQQALDNAQAIINANLSSQLSAAGLDPAAFDLFSSVFNTDGTGFDGLLDSVVITLNPGSGFTINVDGTPISFDPNIDIGGSSSSGDFGTVTLGGTSATELGLSALSPTSYTELNLASINSLSWTSSDGVTSYTLTILDDSTIGSVGFARTVVIQGGQGGIETLGWAQPGISGINITATDVSLNVTLTGGIQNETSLTINGTLVRNSGG